MFGSKRLGRWPGRFFLCSEAIDAAPGRGALKGSSPIPQRHMLERRCRVQASRLEHTFQSSQHLSEGTMPNRHTRRSGPTRLLCSAALMGCFATTAVAKDNFVAAAQITESLTIPYFDNDCQPTAEHPGLTAKGEIAGAGLATTIGAFKVSSVDCLRSNLAGQFSPPYYFSSSVLTLTAAGGDTIVASLGYSQPKLDRVVGAHRYLPDHQRHWRLQKSEGQRCADGSGKHQQPARCGLRDDDRTTLALIGRQQSPLRHSIVKAAMAASVQQFRSVGRPLRVSCLGARSRCWFENRSDSRT